MGVKVGKKLERRKSPEVREVGKSEVGVGRESLQGTNIEY
jgi:hypothetical protein